METRIEQSNSLISQLDDKTKKKLQTQTLLNLMTKIKDNVHPEIEQLLLDVTTTIQGATELSSFQKNLYNKQLTLLKKTVKKEFGYIAKGDIIAERMAIGVGFGVAIGAGLMAVNAAFLGVGIAVGVALGLSIGTTQEKKEEEKGNIY